MGRTELGVAATFSAAVAVPRPQSLSIGQARRIALAAQGFAAKRTALRTPTAVAALVDRLGVLQIDSVNVLVRSHYLPAFSRHGPYPRPLLERAAYDSANRKLFEYWGHEASLLPIASQPLFRWRMERALRGEGVWGRLKRYASEHRDAVIAILSQVRERGPLGASELTNAGKSKGSWWGWSQGKEILEWLFWTGQITTASRRNFERLYDIPERVIPADILSMATPTKESAQMQLMAIAARALGVATLRDLRDYFRLPVADAAAALTALNELGIVTPVSIEGWKQPAYLHREARIPRTVEAAALLSPFDALIWERQRTQRLFDFHFRLEIYTPAAKRLHGYYVLPFLMDEHIAARVDLKADRQSSALVVRGGSLESHAEANEVAPRLKRELQSVAEWLELDKVKIESRRGELMRVLRS